MKILDSIHTKQYELEVVECDCGFHMGIDATYLDQVGGVRTICPACKKVISVGDNCNTFNNVVHKTKG